MGRKDNILIFSFDFHKSDLEYIFIPLLITSKSHFMNCLLSSLLGLFIFLLLICKSFLHSKDISSYLSYVCEYVSEYMVYLWIVFVFYIFMCFTFINFKCVFRFTSDFLYGVWVAYPVWKYLLSPFYSVNMITGLGPMSFSKSN